MNKYDIINKLEEFAPLSLQEQWDNSGWQIKTDNDEIKNIIVCVSPTTDVLQQTIEKKVELIISHHPLILSPLSCVEDEFVLEAIKNNIQLYSMHTNFDKASGGTSSYLANKFGCVELKKLNEYVRIGELETPLDINDLVLKTKITFNLSKLKVINYRQNVTIKKIAFCAGSGGSFLSDLNNQDVDLFVTSDIKYHNEIKKLNYMVFDIGHLESERPALEKIVSLIGNDEITVFVANEKNSKIYL